MFRAIFQTKIRCFRIVAKATKKANMVALATILAF
jgi:hypothetical protein